MLSGGWLEACLFCATILGTILPNHLLMSFYKSTLFSSNTPTIFPNYFLNHVPCAEHDICVWVRKHVPKWSTYCQNNHVPNHYPYSKHALQNYCAFYTLSEQLWWTFFVYQCIDVVCFEPYVFVVVTLCIAFYRCCVFLPFVRQIYVYYVIHLVFWCHMFDHCC